MAPGALDGQAEERRAGGGDHVVQVVGTLLEHALDRLVADDVVRAADEEAGRRPGERVGLGGGQRIPGELFEHEPGERRVAVEARMT